MDTSSTIMFFKTSVWGSLMFLHGNCFRLWLGPFITREVSFAGRGLALVTIGDDISIVRSDCGRGGKGLVETSFATISLSLSPSSRSISFSFSSL
jgi:hypothetical protein